MPSKTYVPEGQDAPASQIGATMEALAATIAARRAAGEESYTHQLLTGPLDKPLKKVAEEAVEVGLAAKDVCSAVLRTAERADAATPSGTGSCPSAAAGRTEVQPSLASGQSPAPERASLACVQPGTSEKAALSSAELDPAVDEAIDHLRYEAADVVYHLLVVLERFGISIDEFAAELNSRMTDEERPEGALLLTPEHIKRGK